MPKISYYQGQAKVVQGSPRVEGIKTYWLQKVNAGDIFYLISPEEVTGKLHIASFYEIESVVSDTVLMLREPYKEESLSGVSYNIDRYPERYLTSEENKALMKILDKYSVLDSELDSAKEYVNQSQIYANASKQYAAESAQSAEEALDRLNQIIVLHNKTVEAKEIAVSASQTATIQAEIATEQAVISTSQAGESTNQANRAEEIVNNFISNGNQAGGAVIIGPDGKIPVDLVPGSLKDIKSYATITAFPPTGESGYFYLALDTNRLYLWATSPANMYVPVDTTLSLAGNGAAETAARSDHNHDLLYEPLRDFIFSGNIQETIDINNIVIKDGYYAVENNAISVNVVGYEELFNIHLLIVKTVHLSDSRFVQHKTGFLYQDNRVYILYNCRELQLRDGYKIYNDNHTQWYNAEAYNAQLLNNESYNFVNKEDFGRIDHSKGVFFIEEDPELFSFAVKSINGIFPDGTGNVALDISNKGSILANPDDYPLYRNANNIKTDNQAVFVQFHLFGSLENYPEIEDPQIYFIRCNASGDIFFQECIALDTSGVITRWNRFGTSTLWQHWVQM